MTRSQLKGENSLMNSASRQLSHTFNLLALGLKPEDIYKRGKKLDDAIFEEAKTVTDSIPVVNSTK